MTWPTIFANLSGGNQPLSLFDTMFNQVAVMVPIPSTPSGTNAITLTPIGNAPALSGYQNYCSFRFVAGATTTGAVTAQYQALGFLNVFLADGVTQASTGNIQINQQYDLVFAQFLNAGAGGFFLEAASVTAGVSTFVPNIQVFLSGSSLTYTTPTAGGRLPLYLRGRMVGAGGGGGARTTNSGGGGGTTQFENWTAIGGNGGAPASGLPGAGGSGGVNGSGTVITRVSGQNGFPGPAGSSGFGVAGGAGGVSFFGGAGSGINNGAGGSAASNSGSGGAGGGNLNVNPTGAGGGAGEYVEFLLPSPAASYVYTVGSPGGGGSAGGAAGGSGGDGRIEIIAAWQ